MSRRSDFIAVLLAVVLIGGCSKLRMQETYEPTLTPGLTESAAMPHTPTDVPTEEPTPSKTPSPDSITGFVIDDDGPVAGATVRQKATENKTLTATDGSFTLEGWDRDGLDTITAWADGYFVGWVEEVHAAEQPLTITLRQYYTYDNADYDWFSVESAEGSLSCSHCMPCYEEWVDDAHSQSAINPRFLTMYNGTDMAGNQSPLTEYSYTRDYGTFPLPPDPSQPYYGPGYKLDFQDSAGNCATCHVPVQAAHPGLEYSADPNQASGIELEGVFCEFCHKIGGVTLNPDTGLPYTNMPGVLSMQLFRPAGEDQIFFGNFDDVTRRVSYLPLEEESAFCAPCHFGVFWDEVIYNSYGEWLESPYSDPNSGQTCQDCHMEAVDYDYFVYPEKGGVIRDSSRIFSHYMPGAADQAFLSDGLSMEVEAEAINSEVVVRVTLINDNTGHNIPTDFPARNMILLVKVVDEGGNPLSLKRGETVPDWGGIGEPEEGYYAGLPGKGYALVLQEIWTGVVPSSAYWNPVRVHSDTRLKPFEVDENEYVFRAPEGGGVQVQVKLIYRRAFKELMDQKVWEFPDIVIKIENLHLP